jgi:hypothetical protein
MSMLADDAWFAFGQFVTRGKGDTFNGLKKAFCRSFSNVTHAMVPKVHRFDHLSEEGSFSGAFARRVNELKIYEV